MEEVDDGDGLLVEVDPEGVLGLGVVDVHILDAHHGHLDSLHQQDLSFLGVGGEHRRVHSETVKTMVIVEADYEEDGVKLS